MSDGPPIPALQCVFCGYSLAGLPTSTCPECGKVQPPPSEKRLVRADRIWLTAALVGLVAFAGLSRLALALGTALGAEYTGDVELVGFTVGFAVIAAIYAIAAVEIFIHRTRFRRVPSGTLVAVALTMILGGFFAFAVVFVVMLVR